MFPKSLCRFPELALLLFAAAGISHAQGGVLKTVAGTQGLVLPAPVPALQAPLNQPGALAADRFGNLYIAVTADSVVLRVSPDGTLAVVAGTGSKSYSSDGGAATQASLNGPEGIAVDSAGNLYIADTGNYRVREVMADGTIRTVAGGGGSSSDGTKATTTRLINPAGITVDAAGNLFIVDNDSIRKVGSDGMIHTVLKNTYGIGGMAVDSGGNLFYANTSSSQIDKVDPAGKVTVVAGLASGSGFSGDGGPATTATLSSPHDVMVDGAGNLYIADTSNGRIRRVTAAGIITTLAGVGNSSSAATSYGDGGPAAAAILSHPSALAMDPAGNLYIADTGHNRIRKISPAGSVSTVAGSGMASYLGEGVPAVGAKLDGPLGLAVDRLGNVFIADSNNHRVRKVGVDGIIATVAGNGVAAFSGDGGQATSASLNAPAALALDASGNLYIADTGNNRIRKVTPAGVIGTIAGSGDPPFTFGFSGDGAAATAAKLWQPSGVAVDSAGNLYIADQVNARIRKVTAGGTISTLAGGGQVQTDGGAATSAKLSMPQGVAVDAGGTVYFTESDRVRKVTPAGVIGTFAGSGKWTSDLGEGGPATNAYLQPRGVAIDAAGICYISDESSRRIRKVALNGNISSVVGLYRNFCCEGMLATSAAPDDVTAVTVDPGGTLYFSDSLRDQVFKVAPETYTSTAKPVLLSVIHAADYLPRMAPYTWITLQGTDLAPATRSWADADFVNGQLPTQLNGVRVYVAGLPCYISYISPTQINALVGGTFDMYQSTFGTAPVEILRPEGRSDAFIAQVGSCCQPGLFRYSAAAGKYVVAQGADGAFIGPPGLIAGLYTRPARPGEIITMYGTGFGPTSPAIAPATAVFPPAAAASQVWLDVSGIDLDPMWAGLIGPGLYQLNFVVPGAPDGDYSFKPVAGGVSGATAWITIQR